MSTEKRTTNYFLHVLTILMLIVLIIPSGSVDAQTPSRKAAALEAGLIPLDGSAPWHAEDTESIVPTFASQLIQDGSFEAYSPGSGSPYWTEYDSYYGTPLCSGADCGFWTNAHPYNGYAWAWFGAAQLPTHTASLSQVVNFPSCGTGTLKFYFWIGYAQTGSGTNDVFYAKIDGKTVFTANATQRASYSSYKLISINLSSLAKGAAHTIAFSHVNTKQDVGFHVDDVSLIWNECSEISGNADVAGVTLSYVDGTAKTVTSNGSGEYSFTVPHNWSGTVTPSHACFAFAPPSRSYGNITTNQIDQDYGATPVPAAGCADIDVLIGGASQGIYWLPPSGSMRPRFQAVNNGPVKISTVTDNIIASQRVIFSGKSYSEMMGLPLEQLSNEYWFPYYNNVAMDSQLRISNLGNVPTTITVTLGTTEIDSYTLATGAATRKNYPGQNSGPLKVHSSATDILSTVRVLYGGKSYSELMGLPVEQLTNEYLFPYYNNVAMDSQLRVSNLGNVPTTITVTLGTTEIDSYVLAAGAATRKNYPGMNSGPLKVHSSATDILSTIRVLFNSKSYSELMGFPANQLAKEYSYPVYDNVALDSQLRVSNVGVGPTTITVYAGGSEIDSYTLAAGAATRKNYAGKNTGPLQVISSAEPILTTIRMLYNTPGFSSLYEMTGLPVSQLSTAYYFPWYNNVAMNSQLRFAVP